MNFYFSLFVDLIFFWSLFCLIKANERTNIVALDNNKNDSSSEEITEDNLEMNGFTKKYFMPTKEWNAVDEGDIILSGLEYRINLKTGLKEARLMEGDNGDEYYRRLNVLKMKDESIEKIQENIVSEEFIEALKQLKSEDGKTVEDLQEEAKIRKPGLRSYEELKKELKELNVELKSDFEIIDELLGKFSTSQTDHNDVINIFEDLEYLVHQIENAVYFVDKGGLKIVILPSLNATITEVQIAALEILGSATQSNPKVQIAALEADLISHLLNIIAFEEKTPVCSKAMYALSCIVRGFPFGQKLLVKNGGLDALKKVFHRRDPLSLPLKFKVIMFLQDLLTERREAKPERQQQLEQIKLPEALQEGNWCPLAASLIHTATFDKRDLRQDMGSALNPTFPLRPEHDLVDKAVTALTTFVPICQSGFRPLVPLLQSLASTYSDLALKEKYQGDDGYEVFREIEQHINSLVVALTSKDEL